MPERKALQARTGSPVMDNRRSGTPTKIPPRPTGGQARVPAYRQIMTDLAERINRGEFHDGMVLAGEPDLAKTYGVSRMTVRQALAGLAEHGLVERRHGMGTIVRRHKLSRELQQPIGLTEEIRAQGHVPGSHVLSLKEIKPPPPARRSLWLGPKAKVVLLRRLRYADGLLIGLQESYIPCALAPGLAEVDFEDASLSALLRVQHGLVASYVELVIESIEADQERADLLGIAPGTALLRSTSVSFLAHGRPLEQTTGWFLGTRYSYRLVRGSAPPESAAVPGATSTVDATPSLPHRR